MYGVLPTGRGPADDRPLVSLYWSLALDDHARWQADGLDAWKAEVRSFDPRIEPVLGCCGSAGSGSTPGPRSPRTARPSRRS